MNSQTSSQAVTEPQSYRPIAQLLPVEWAEATVQANGIQQHYLRSGRGDKPALLLLHGFMESGASWLRVAKALATRYDVIMPDARVHGGSAGAEGGFSPEILMADVLALIQSNEEDFVGYVESMALSIPVFFNSKLPIGRSYPILTPSTRSPAQSYY